MTNYVGGHAISSFTPSQNGDSISQLRAMRSWYNKFNFIEEGRYMRSTRLVAPLVAAGVIAVGISTSTAWAGGPGGAIEDSNDISVAVGSGVFVDGLVGFKASGATNEEASAQVIAQCQSAGGQECTSDEVTNDNLCIVSVGDDSNEIVAGGAGVTVEAARDDAFQRAAANGTPLGPTAAIVISDCH